LITTKKYRLLQICLGKWPGLTGMLLNGTIDISDSVWITPILLGVVDFIPVGGSLTTLIAGRQRDNIGDPMNFLVYSPIVLLMNTISIIALLLLMIYDRFIVEKIGKFFFFFN
jgi:hypothetical protein